MIDIQHLKDFLVKIHSTNVKAPIDFDNKYGTKISQQYNFPFGFTDDAIWKIMEELPISVRNSGVSDGSELAELYSMILYSLEYKHFPFDNIINLSLYTKVDILRGMCSNFNVEDIISFSIYNIVGYNSLASELIKNYYTENYNEACYKSIDLHIKWVPSLVTAEKNNKNC